MGEFECMLKLYIFFCETCQCLKQNRKMLKETIREFSSCGFNLSNAIVQKLVN